MSHDSATQAVRAVQDQLPPALGDKLLALYLFGSAATGRYQPASDVNLLLVAAPGATLAELGAAFAPLWRAHGSILRRGPAAVSPDGLQRLLALDPNFGYHLHHEGQHLFGSGGLAAEPAPFDPRTALARDCRAALVASSALAPSMLSPETARERQSQLAALARRLGVADPPAATADLFTAIHAVLEERLTALGEADDDSPPIAGAPPLLPALRAIYERANDVVLVLPDCRPATLVQIDWPAVTKLVAGTYSSLRVTSIPQLCLIAAAADPLSIALRHFSHVWGHDPLDELSVDLATILHAAALHAARAHAFDLPGVTLTDERADLHIIIHDFQNKLLNIQLQHELFHRLFALPRVEAQPALLGRDAAPAERIEVIRSQLDWWTTYYITSDKAERTPDDSP